MAQLKLHGRDLEIFANPALKSMWGDLMGAADLGEAEAEAKVRQSIEGRYPKLMDSAKQAERAMNERCWPVDRFEVRGDFLIAYGPAKYGHVQSASYRITG